jgi:hypothetical protein
VLSSIIVFLAKEETSTDDSSSSLETDSDEVFDMALKKSTAEGLFFSLCCAFIPLQLL